MQITVAGMIYLPILLLSAIFGNYKFNLKLFILMSAFTTVEVINIGENGILAYHISFVLILIKFLHINRWRFKGKVNLLGIFVLYAGATIPLSILYGGIDIISVDGGHGVVKFSFQQFTQYAYLLIAYFTSMIIKYSIKQDRISIYEIEKTGIFTLAVVVSIGFLQKLLPLDFINTFFRNSVHAIYNTEGVRLSSTFSEPSMLALFVTPIICALAYNLIMNRTKAIFSTGVILLAGVALLTISYASSFVFGLFVGIVVWIFLIIREKKMKIASLKRISMAVMLGFTAILPFRESIFSNIELLMMKLFSNKNIISGVVRKECFLTSINAFFKSNLIGVGWGSLRSTDLFSTLLAEVGLVGNILLYVYIIKSLTKILKIGTRDATMIFMLQIISLAVLFISVPEFYYLYIWIYWAMGDALIDINKGVSNYKLRLY